MYGATLRLALLLHALAPPESRVESRDSSIEHRALSIALVSRLARHHDFFGPKKKPLEGPTHPTIQPSPKSTQQLRTILPIRITAPSHPPQPSSLAGVLRADNRVPTYCTVRFSSARHLRACACACWLLWSVCLPACLSVCLPACLPARIRTLRYPSCYPPVSSSSIP